MMPSILELKTENMQYKSYLKNATLVLVDKPMKEMAMEKRFSFISISSGKIIIIQICCNLRDGIMVCMELV